ncbi:hypothetical protein E2C01_088880 [Portunus trituberculatus]|uniref:Uncharacterized protein n=1 Tax=Portunus trituberculatus TaxID=210409 RepID=A0A5B7JAI1_PORTR|nr:hypothetical protein [Portunus trituberculatus]
MTPVIFQTPPCRRQSKPPTKARREREARKVRRRRRLCVRTNPRHSYCYYLPTTTHTIATTPPLLPPHPSTPTTHQAHPQIQGRTGNRHAGGKNIPE